MQLAIEKIWENRDLLKEKSCVDNICEVIAQLDNGTLRVAEPLLLGGWKVNDWIKKQLFYIFLPGKWKPWKLGRLNITIKLN